MIPQAGQSVSVFLRNGAQLVGNVVSWDLKIVLESEHQISLTVINNVDDILYYKVFIKKEEYAQLRDTVKKAPEDIKKIAELKKEMNELEKEEIKDNLRTFQAGEIKSVEYGLPKFFTVPSTIKHSEKKAGASIPEFGEELQNVFNKK